MTAFDPSILSGFTAGPGAGSILESMPYLNYANLGNYSSGLSAIAPPAGGLGTALGKLAPQMMLGAGTDYLKNLMRGPDFNALQAALARGLGGGPQVSMRPPQRPAGSMPGAISPIAPRPF